MRLAALALIVLAACGPSLAQMQLDQVAARRSEAQQRPGPRQAQAYAEAVHDAYTAGAYGQDTLRLNADVDAAVAVLDSASASGGPDAPTLIAWKALVLIDASRHQEGFAELQRSMELGPNLMAAKNLVVIYGVANRPKDVGDVCLRTVPELTDAGEQYWLIEHCKENMNALSEEAALAWATPEIVAWYREQQQRHAAEAAYERQQRAEQDERERQVGHEIEICIADSKERGYRCINKCHGDARCESNCEQSYQASLERCEAEARLKLGR